MRKWIAGAAATVLTVSLLSGCGSSNSEARNDPNQISGESTVITQRTDIVDTVFQDYAREFEKLYPDVKVNSEALSDYEGQIKDL